MIQVETLKEYLSYNPHTGVIKWKKRPSNRVQINSKAGYVADGYVVLRLKGRMLKAHRVAWALHYGEYPKNHIDHIDGDRKNNKIVNLRDVTQQINNHNLTKPQTNNKTKVLGVLKIGSRFAAQICVNGHRKHLGMFDTAEEASEAYKVAKTQALRLIQMCKESGLVLK